jgi:hypothetical protein
MVTETSAFTNDAASPVTESTSRPVAVPRQIPWGYGRDRLTAIAVDPDQLFVYWEVLDDSIEAVRAQLGPAGARAALVLRVYDTSGRIFDGVNAHSFFDQDVHRNDRQWFCNVGKPSSSAHIEMGLRTQDGRFAKVMRSGRVDFPRGEPAPRRATEWMRVTISTGEIVGRDTALPSSASNGSSGTHGHGFMAAPDAAPAGGAEGGSAPTDGFEHYVIEPYEVNHFEVERYETDSGWQIDPADPATVYRMVTMSWQEVGLGSSTWESGVSESSWEAGPFSYPTEVIVPAAERFEGAAQVYRSGEQVRVLYGPWQVVIRGIGAHSSRRVLGRWEVHRTWASVVKWAGDASGLAGRHTQSRHNGSSLGASERHALSASELRIRGASEVFYLGASERRLGGASETRFMGASQFLARGASERRLSGASEWRLSGASELRLFGASERRLAGASERRLAGASERRLAGASEKRLGGASEPRLANALHLVKSKED